MHARWINLLIPLRDKLHFIGELFKIGNGWFAFLFGLIFCLKFPSLLWDISQYFWVRFGSTRTEADAYSNSEPLIWLVSVFC